MTGNHVVTTFHPILVNGEPYIPEPEQPDCYCRRCYLHNDPGGCVATLAAVKRAASIIEAIVS